MEHWIKYRIDETYCNCPLAVRVYYKHLIKVAHYYGYDYEK